MAYYTDSQLEIILQFIDEENIGEIETMSYGAWTALGEYELKKLYERYKLVWLNDDPYEVHMIPKNLLI